MKKLMSSIALTATLLSTVSPARSVECNQEKWIPLDQTPKISLGACKLQDNLKRAVGTRNPSEPNLVAYWVGSYQRPVIRSYSYHHEVLNLCTGKTLISEIRQRQTIEMLVFAVDNPNLNDAMVASGQSSPMTEGEASLAFAKARSDCEYFQLSDK